MSITKSQNLIRLVRKQIAGGYEKKESIPTPQARFEKLGTIFSRYREDQNIELQLGRGLVNVLLTSCYCLLLSGPQVLLKVGSFHAVKSQYGIHSIKHFLPNMNLDTRDLLSI